MKVFAFDEHMNRIGELKYIQLLWDRKCNEPGGFTLYQQSKHYIEAAYIMAEGRKEIGIVYKPAYKANPNGRYVTTEGKFAEDITNDATTEHGKTIVATKRMNDQFMEYLTKKGIKEAFDSETMKPRDEVVTRCLDVGGEMYRILALDQETFQVQWNDGWEIKFVKPRDTGIRFSKGIGNAKEIIYSQDMSVYKYKCTGYVEIPDDIVKEGYSGTTLIGGKHYETDSFTSTLQVEERFRQKEMSMDFSMPEGLEITAANKAKIKAQIIQMCQLELLNHYVVREIEVTPLQIAGCRYLIDYDLGDIVLVEIPEIGITYEAQIIEVYEVWEKNIQTYTITLGHKRIRR
jgi:hypothetical protein